MFSSSPNINLLEMARDSITSKSNKDFLHSLHDFLSSYCSGTSNNTFEII